jgi:hypothetical protein
MENPTYFADFLKEIRLTKSQIADCKSGHEILRRRLTQYDDLAPIIVSTFLQGSYRRSTAIRPNGDKRADVDVIVVTNLDHTQVTPDQAFQKFLPFMEKYYKGKYKVQGRSFGIELSYVDLDLVITVAPSERDTELLKSAAVISEKTIEEAAGIASVFQWAPLERSGISATASQKSARWRPEPLYIPDRERKTWDRTHPLAQMEWTANKNQRCNRHYVNVVKAIKWWRLTKHPKPERPKGYPLEHIVGTCCPDGTETMAKGVCFALEAIVQRFDAYAAMKQCPRLSDHGVPELNVLQRVSGEDFATFHSQVCDAAKTARQALDEPDDRKSARLWRSLFGEKFPEPPPDDRESDGGPGGKGPSQGGYTPRKDVSIIGGTRFA